MTAPFAVQTMFVSAHPVSALSVTYLSLPSWTPVKSNGALVVGLVVAVLRVNGASPVPETV